MSRTACDGTCPRSPTHSPTRPRTQMTKVNGRWTRCRTGFRRQIAAPAYPASILAGTEAVFWAGSSLDRGFAYSDAAAYDPSTETWRSASAPGWGHPGLISVEVDGLLFATAKGSIGRLDVDTGDWVELPAFDQLEIRSIAPGDGASGRWAPAPRSRHTSASPSTTPAPSAGMTAATSAPMPPTPHARP